VIPGPPEKNSRPAGWGDVKGRRRRGRREREKDREEEGETPEIATSSSASRAKRIGAEAFLRGEAKMEKGPMDPSWHRAVKGDRGGMNSGQERR